MMAHLTPDQQREIVSRFQRTREEIDQLYAKISQIESDRNEHVLVLKQLTGLESDRRCWHQIGGVLAEKKVGDVVPILAINRDQFAASIVNVKAALHKKEKDLAELQKKYSISEVRK